jgi:hypothetical protein
VRRAAACLLVAAVGSGCGDSASPERGAPRVVAILAAGSERAVGFVVRPGRVVTVAHAVQQRRTVRVRDRRAAPRRARILRVDRGADLALLAVPGLGGPVARTSTTGDEGGVRVVLLRDGRFLSRAARVRRAIDARVSAPGPVRPVRRPALELEARLRAGDSGAPVLTEDDEVAGVLFARSRNRPDTAYAVDASVLVEFLAEYGG